MDICGAGNSVQAGMGDMDVPLGVTMGGGVGGETGCGVAVGVGVGVAVGVGVFGGSAHSPWR